MENLNNIAARIRGRIIQMSHQSGAPHLASALSTVDILVAAYWNILDLSKDNVSSPDRDRFILSKGHAASALYATLSFKDIIPEKDIAEFATPGAKLAEQPGPNCAPGVEWATGSLGHGLGVGIGMSLAAKIQNRDYKTMVLMSDGECNEGSVWEAAMFAPVHKLGKLTAIVDYNKWQATGRSQEILSIHPLTDKWQSFGWHVQEVDGHDTNALTEAMHAAGSVDDQPSAIIANTIKGKGVDFMEDDNNWHYRIPTAEEVATAKQQLNIA